MNRRIRLKENQEKYTTTHPQLNWPSLWFLLCFKIKDLSSLGELSQKSAAQLFKRTPCPFRHWQTYWNQDTHTYFVSSLFLPFHSSMLPISFCPIDLPFPLPKKYDGTGKYQHKNVQHEAQTFSSKVLPSW